MLKQACDSIAKELYDSAHVCERGFYWKTLQSGPEGKTEPGTNESIYHGVSGISYFFFHYGRITGNSSYGEMAAGAMKALVSELKEGTEHFSPALYTGRLGTLYTLLKGKQLGFLPEAEGLVEQLLPSLSNLDENSLIVDDFINGNVGVVLGCMLCYQLNPRQEWLDIIDKLLPMLFKKAYFSNQGLYWDRSRDIINGLCGLSHGASGFAHVFSELYKSTQNLLYKEMALAAMLYERQHYKADWHNWQDLRKSFMLPRDVNKNLEKYAAGDYDFFTKGVDMNAWCHGAAGIGLQRIYGGDVLNDYPYLKEEIDACLQKTEETDLQPSEREMQIMCHGGAGNAMVFVAQYVKTGAEDCLEKAKKVLESEVKEAEARGNYRCGYGVPETTTDQSLFMGNAGVAYAILRVLHPTETEDILCPQYAGPSLKDLLKPIPAKTALGWILEKYQVAAPNIDGLIKMDLNTLKTILSEDDFNKVSFDAGQKSHALNHVAALYRSENPVNDLSQTEFRLADNTHFFVEGEEGKIEISEGIGIRFMDLPDLAAAILDQLDHKKPKGKEAIFSTIFEEYEIEEAEKEQVATALENQLIELVNAAIVAIEK